MNERVPDPVSPPGEFEAAFRRHYAPLVKRLSVILGDPQWAEEAAQEAFCRALARWPQLRGVRHLEAWLYTVARNVARDGARFRARALLLPARLMAGGQPMPSAPAGIEEAVEIRLGAEEVARALERLPVPYREVLFLHYYEGRSLQEIAQLTRVALGTVKSRLHRARQALRRLLAEAADRLPEPGRERP